MDEEEDIDAVLRKHPLSGMKPSERWPYEPPAPDLGPEGGVREPRRPRPSDEPDAAELAVDEVSSED
jgi:hypothetical protein